MSDQDRLRGQRGGPTSYEDIRAAPPMQGDELRRYLAGMQNELPFRQTEPFRQERSLKPQGSMPARIWRWLKSKVRG